jgi:guanylate kinase
MPDLNFSISCTTRKPRGAEKHGVEYYFLSEEEFVERIHAGEFVEHAQVHANRYGTLKSEMERIWAKGNVIIFDVDVMGGINLKRIFGDNACSIFIQAPSIEALRERLTGRGTDSIETIEKRIAKAEFELSKAPEFDYVVVNDNLDKAVADTKLIINDFLAR